MLSILKQPFFRTSGRILTATALLLLGDLILQPITGAVSAAQHRQGLKLPPPAISRRDALSQQLAFFILGGLRSLAAEITTLEATRAWLKRDWPQAESLWNTITTLAPRRENYWAAASREMSTNAAGDYLSDERMDGHEQAVLVHHYIKSGENFLLQGIANNPDSPLLYARLGDFYSDLYRRPEFAKAAEAYARAVELGAPTIYKRMCFYNLCRVKGKEKEALALGRELFADPQNHVPAVRTLIFVLQNKLNLPTAERLNVEQLFHTKERAIRQLRLFRHNTLRYPTYGIEEFLQQNAN